MDRRVLIVESQNDFALSMASVLKTAGYHTAMAGNAADAQRELEKRRPDLVVLRAELPDQSGFVLCGQIKKGKFGQNLRVLLLSSDVGQEGLTQHAQSANAADGYLVIPFEMGELAEMTAGIMPPPTPDNEGDADDMDLSLDSALAGTMNGAPPEPPGPPSPPPIRTGPPGGPPKLPKRERRSAITDEDRQFLDRTFQSIAERKAELLAESRQVKRPAPRRDLMGTPEGKIQILRDELKIREAQVARISEIWTVRERELLSGEDRLHEKDVELQGLKMQVDDLLRRFNDAQQTLVQKDREHGATVDDLLLQKFATEKDLIEVVASKEKDINVLRRELSGREDEVTRRGAELDSVHADYEKLDKQLNVTTIEFEVKEQKLTEEVKNRDLEISALRGDLQKVEGELKDTITERDARYARFEHDFNAQQDDLTRTRLENETSVKNLNNQLAAERNRGDLAAQEIERLHTERADLEQKLQAQIADLEAQVTATQTERDQFRMDGEQTAQMLNERLSERDAKIAAITQELAETVAKHEATEADLTGQIQQKLEQIGELEGVVEATRAQLTDREDELGAEISALTDAKNKLERDLLARLDDSSRQIAGLNEQVFGLQTDVSSRDQVIESQRDELAQLADAKDTLEQDLTAKLTATDKHLANTETTLAKTQDDLSVTQEKLATVEGDLQATQGALEETQRGYDQAQVQLSDTITQRDQLSKQLASTRAELGERSADLAKARSDIDALHANVAAVEKAKADLGAQYSELQGNYEALGNEHESLGKQLESTQVELASTQAHLSDEKAAVAELENQLGLAKDQNIDLSEQLSALKQELGARVAEVTQLTSQYTQAEESRHSFEERLHALTEESQRREGLWNNDLAQKSQELSDTQRKLTATTQEKQRQGEALSRDVAAKTEQLKQLEFRVKQVSDESKKKNDELMRQLEANGVELESVRGELGEQLQAAKNAQAQALAERDKTKETLTAQLLAQTAKNQDVMQQLQTSKQESKRAYDELFSKYSKADAKLAQVSQELQSHGAEMDAKLKEAQTQLAARTKKIQELELALENSHGAKVRAEKEGNSKAATAEARANDAASKLAGLMREKKELDGRHLREMEELNAKQKAELERRDQLKAQEVARLQQTVQEKSKALKVVELELARYKTKGTAPGTAKPVTGAVPVAKAASAEESDGPTRLDISLSGAAGSSIAQTTQPNIKAPAGRPPSGAHAPAKPALPPAKKATLPPGEDRKMMAGKDSEDDWTALVDDLDK